MFGFRREAIKTANNMANVIGWKKSKVSGKSRIATLKVNGKVYQIECCPEKKWDAEAEKETKKSGETVGNCWREIQSKEERDNAFSIVKADTCFGNKKDEEDYEYIILMDGKRPGIYSRTGSGTGWGLKNFIPLLEEMDTKVKAVCILVDKDAPLEKQAELLAKHVERLKNDGHCKKVHVLGHSKCGTMNVAMLKYLSDDNLDKLNIMSYSAPYRGTIFASPKAFEERLAKVVDAGREKILKGAIKQIKEVEPATRGIVFQGILSTLTAIYRSIFANAHMDLDIYDLEMGKAGIYPEQLERLDEKYLGEMFGEDTLAKLRKVKFTNITTYCTKQTLDRAVREHDIVAGIMWLSSTTIFKKGEKSDGTVGLESARYIEQVCKKRGIEISTIKIDSGHHGLFSAPDILKKIFEELIYNKRSQEQEAKGQERDI